MSLALAKFSSLLPKEIMNSLQVIQLSLKQALETSQVFRTKTEMEVSVLKDIKHTTPDSKYWQAVKEQEVMLTNLIRESFEYRRKQLRKADFEHQLAKSKLPLQKEAIQIEIESLDFEMEILKKTSTDRARELLQWEEIKNELKPKMAYGTDDCNEHQLVSYGKEFLNEMLVMGNSGGPADRRNVIGKAHAALKTASERGLLDKVLDGYSKEQQEAIKSRVHEYALLPAPET